MPAVSTDEMIKYLHTAVELESSIVCQEESKKRASKELERRKPTKRLPPEPSKKAVPRPIYQNQSTVVGTNWQGSLKAGIIFAGVGVIFGIITAFVVGMILPFLVITGIGLIVGSIFAIPSLLLRNHHNKLLDEDKIVNDERQKQYEAECQKAAAEYQAALEQYKRECQYADQDYQRKLMAYNKAEKALYPLSETIRKTEETLSELYNLDWIFPKYRNMVAVCTFYEYFMSGRCSTLTGADGAYNLYEAELRQNLIINKLDMIVSQLEQIKQNQYTLYTEMKKATAIAESISKDISQISSQTDSIAEATSVIALCSKATAQNTEALKYISLIR